MTGLTVLKRKQSLVIPRDQSKEEETRKKITLSSPHVISFVRRMSPYCHLYSCHLRQSCFHPFRRLVLTVVTTCLFFVVIEAQLKVTVPKIPQAELDTIVEQATLNVKRRLEVIEPSILAAGESSSPFLVRETIIIDSNCL